MINHFFKLFFVANFAFFSLTSNANEDSNLQNSNIGNEAEHRPLLESKGAASSLEQSSQDGIKNLTLLNLENQKAKRKGRERKVFLKKRIEKSKIAEIEYARYNLNKRQKAAMELSKEVSEIEDEDEEELQREKDPVLRYEKRQKKIALHDIEKRKGGLEVVN